MFFGDEVPRYYRIVDPRNGNVISEGVRSAEVGETLETGNGPCVVICYKNVSVLESLNK